MNALTKRFVLQAGAIAAAALFIAQASPAKAVENYVWAAGSPGGSWYTIVTGLANIVMEKNQDIKIRIVPGGGRDNPALIDNGIAQIGMGIDFLAAAATKGEAPYDKKMPSLRSIGGTWAPAEFHVIVPADEKRPLDQILADPKIRIGTSPRATSEELTLQRALTFYNNSGDKIAQGGGKLINANYSQLVSAFQDNQVDVLWGAGSAPTGIALEVQNGRRAAKLVAFPKALMDHLASQFGYGKSVIKAKSYTGLQSGDADLPVTSLEAVILVSSKLSDNDVYKITKTLIESRGSFGNIYKVLGEYDPARAWKDQPVPLHPGAERAYKELGFIK